MIMVSSGECSISYFKLSDSLVNSKSRDDKGVRNGRGQDLKIFSFCSRPSRPTIWMILVHLACIGLLRKLAYIMKRENVIPSPI